MWHKLIFKSLILLRMKFEKTLFKYSFSFPQEILHNSLLKILSVRKTTWFSFSYSKLSKLNDNLNYFNLSEQIKLILILSVYIIII